jgi:FMN phosphatase YigB (HAD superfamily)
MIKNIVFDLGNVLISFNPSEFLDKKNYPENIKTRILSDIFQSNEWKKLDNGDLNTIEAIKSIASHSSLKKEEIALIFKLRTELIYPIDENVSLLPELKKRGLRLYFLSNFPGDIFEEIRSGYYFFKYFDGGIISAEVNLSKPDIRIYRALIDKYSLIPEESLFIDDIEVNVMAAEETGMKGFTTNGKTGMKNEIEKILNQS